MRGRLPAFFRRAAAAALAALAIAAAPTDLAAQDIADIARHTRFAYVETGDPAVDRVSAQGLAGLAWVLRARTAIEAGPPVAVNPATDDLAFFPLVYWPATESQPPPSDAAFARIDAYLRAGGLILFDTRGPLSGDADGGGGARRQPAAPAVARAERPAAAPRPARPRADPRVLPDRPLPRPAGRRRHLGRTPTRTGSMTACRRSSSAATTTPPPGRRDADGFPLYPVIPGTDRQREWALRFGVNLAMYALTGNYKADQVHIPAILRRLGRAEPEMPE